jgi:hypothetical protein
MSKAGWRWGLAVLLLLLPVGLVYYPRVPPDRCEVVIDMQAGDSPGVAAGHLEVWVNSTAAPSVWQDCVPGVRHSYRVVLENIRAVDYLRLDPTDLPDVPVRVYEVRIEGGGQVLRSFAPRDLARWWYTNAGRSALEGDALALHARHGDPRLEGHFPAVRLPGAPPGRLTRLARKLVAPDQDRNTALLILAASALVVLGLGLLRGGRVAAGVVLASVPLTYAAVRLIGRLGGRPPEGRSAIGYAIYSGYPKSLEFVQALPLAAVPALVALAAVYLRRRLALPAPTEPPPPERRQGRSGWVVLALVTAGLACYFYPDLASACPTAGPPVALGWDCNNSLAWQYLIQTGARPFKDFWYPYSAQMVFELAFPRGEVCLALHRFVLFTVFLLAVYRNTGRSLAATAAIFGTVFGMYVNGLFEWAERYGLVVNVVLAHLAVGPGARRVGWGHVLFWVAAVHLLVMEPTGVVYAGLPLFVSFALDAVRSPAAFRAGLVGRVVREFAVPAAALAGVGVYLAFRGELTGFLAFMASLGTQAAYGAYPIELRTWLRLGAPSESFLVWSVVFLTCVGLVQEFGPEARRGPGRVLLLLGLAGVMLLLKQFMRPHIANQLLVVNVVGLLFYLFAGRKANAWQWGAAALAGGLLYVNLVASSAPARVWHRLLTTAARVRSSAPFLTLGGEERQALAALRFAPDHFQLTGAHLRAFQALQAFAHSGQARPLFVLSDDPVFYILTGQRPYYHTNGYNAAPIREQQHVVQLLRDTPPQVVVWRPADQGVDCVPPVLRDPLVYEHVLLHYVPDPATAGDFALLRRRRPGEPVAVDFWRERLGNTLHLGHIPRFSSMERFPAATGRAGEEEAEFLTVRVSDSAAPAAAPAVPPLPQLGGYRPAGWPLAVPVECAGRRFTLVLSVVPGQSEYHVLLTRLWFWGALKKAGFSPELGKVPPGVEIHIDRRAMDDGILY